MTFIGCHNFQLWSCWMVVKISYVHLHGMMACVCAPSCISSHIHHINSEVRRHFLICDYGICSSLLCTISYPWNMFTYNLCIFFPFSFVSKIWRHFFVPFSFISTLYPVLYPSVSTLDSILSPPVSMLDSISSWFDLTLTTFLANTRWYFQADQIEWLERSGLNRTGIKQAQKWVQQVK